MKKGPAILFCVSLLSILLMACNSFSQVKTTPLEFLKQQEMKYKDVKGEVYLGRVMILNYPAYGVEADDRYHPFLLELTDILKTPLRKNYLMVLKGYSDNSGPAEKNLRFSRERAANLKRLLIDKYYMKEERILTEGHGESDPMASNKTANGRELNRRVEIHITGDISEAVRFIETQEDTR